MAVRQERNFIQISLLGEPYKLTSTNEISRYYRKNKTLLQKYYVEVDRLKISSYVTDILE